MTVVPVQKVSRLAEPVPVIVPVPPPPPTPSCATRDAVPCRIHLPGNLRGVGRGHSLKTPHCVGYWVLGGSTIFTVDNPVEQFQLRKRRLRQKTESSDKKASHANVSFMGKHRNQTWAVSDDRILHLGAHRGPRFHHPK
jgi:hypothetical protein